MTQVEIRQAGRSIAVAQGVTILDAALAEGIAYPHGCRSGRCGACKSRLVEGQVELLEHSRFALSHEEKAQGLILACRAVPTTDASVAWLGGDEDPPAHMSFTPVLSEAPAQTRWRRGLVTDAVAQDLQDLDGWKAYVAGPPAMVEAALRIAAARGLRCEDMHADVFFTPQ